MEKAQGYRNHLKTRKSDPITKGSVPYRSLLPQISTPKTSKANPSSSIIAFDYDVSRGGLVVDLSPHFTSSYAAPSNDESYSSQQCLSSPETLSEGDDNPDDENDQFIQESRDHLFLRCEVSRHLWSLITRRLGYRTFTFHTWTTFTSWLGSQHPTHSSTLRRLAAQATIYILWYERNSRLHNNMSSSPAALFKQLDRLIKDTILARRKMKAFGGLLRRWLAFA
ncbi:BnaC02g43490D [Brassica napus]|uniref:BnaC02g43490D protein n=1 Tax=Brassica napus TaxID=3708 RepID=A0A078HAY5_BRANA|nr:BnaC02g43490D [Brassica napus]